MASSFARSIDARNAAGPADADPQCDRCEEYGAVDGEGVCAGCRAEERAEAEVTLCDCDCGRAVAGDATTCTACLAEIAATSAVLAAKAKLCWDCELRPAPPRDPWARCAHCVAAAEARAAAARVATTTAYAFSPRQGARSAGRTHVILSAPVGIGALRRDAGDALCRPARRFWGLDPFTQDAAADCPRCLALLATHADEIAPPSAAQAAEQTPADPGALPWEHGFDADNDALGAREVA